MKQIDLLLYAVKSLENLHIPYMWVGSLTSSLYGDTRMTLVIELKPEQIDWESASGGICFLKKPKENRLYSANIS